ncbi:hypothetical protein [Methanocella arvoryzae]|uniref:hypothetical protein n=1 Tax=Methanocella arvoryzae TaxID=1175445 RepID=UPI0013051945|nr:hypothetical protein [Methanocella arvoryzae]
MTYIKPKNRDIGIIRVKELEINLADPEQVREKLQENRELMKKYRIEINPLK